MGVDVGTATGYLDLDISGFLQNLQTAQSQAQSSSSSIAKAGDSFKAVGDKLTSVGSTLTKSVSTPIVGLGTAVIKTSADFESSMSKVQSISGATGKDFDDLNKKAREMGAKTKFSASESAEAFQYMAMAGWKTSDMLGGISGVMNLAAASGESLGTVSDIVTDAMTAFGLSASGTSKVLKDGVEKEVDNTTRFVDALAAASNSSNTNVAMLGESFKYVAPVAGSLGYSVEDTAVALGLMANAGIKSSQAGTALRTVLTNMANPTDKMAAAMDALGVSLTNDDGSMKSLMDVLKDLRKGFGEGHLSQEEFTQGIQNLNDQFSAGEIDAKDYDSQMRELITAMYGAEGAEKAQLAAMLAGKEGMSGLLAIVNATDEDFNSLTDSIYNASGTSQEMADIMNDNLNGQITILGSAVQELALQFGEILLPHVKNVVSGFQDLIAKFQEMSPEQKEQIVKWAAIAASIGPALLAFGKIVTSIGSVITAFSKISGAVSQVKSGFTVLQGAMAGVSAPVAALVAVIGTLVAAFLHLWNTNEEFRANITAIWDGIKSKFDSFGQGIVERLNDIGFNFENITEVMSAVWNGFCELLGPIFEGVLTQLSNILSFALDTITGVLDVFIGIFTGNWEQVWQGVQEIFGAAWEFIKNTFQTWVDAFMGIVDTVLGWFGTSWSEVWNSVKEFFVSIWEGIKSFFSTVLTAIQTTASTIWNAIKTVITTVLNAIKTTVTTVWNAIKTTITTVLNAIKTVITTVWNAIKTVISTVLNAIKSTMSTVWNAIKTVIETVVNGIKTTITNVWNAIKTTISTVVNAIKSTIDTVFNAIKTTITNVVNSIKTTVTNTFNNIKSSVTSIVNDLKSTITNVFNGIKTAMSDAMDSARSLVTSAMTNAKNSVINVWNGISSTFAGIGRNIIDGIVSGITGSVAHLYESIKSALSGLVDKAKDALGIASPSKVMRDQIGRWIPEGIAVGFESAMSRAAKDMQESLDEGMDSLHADDVEIGVKNDMVASMAEVAEYLESIEKRLANAVASMRASLEFLIMAGAAAANGVSIGYIGYNGITGRNREDGDSGDDNPDNNGGGGGSTYVFYTSKAIDEIEAARLMKQTERDLAEGFA